MYSRRPYSHDSASQYKHLQFKLDKRAAEFERRAKAQPFLCAEEAWFTTQAILRHLRQKGAELYGADIDRHGQFIRWLALQPAEDGRTPHCGNLGASTVAVWLVDLYTSYLLNYAAMVSAYQRPDIWGVRVANCVCELYATKMREQLRSSFAALETVQKQFPEAARREALAEALVGYFESQLNTSPSYRLGRALQDERQALSDALPAEALAVWADRGLDELNVLRNRISKRLGQLGREASFKDKVADLPGDTTDTGRNDVPLEDFEREHALRQQLADLEDWVERARLSEQQNQVRELDMSTNHDTEVIARELGITTGQVRKVRHDYIQKLRKIAGN